jgi:hypothetical protein
LPLGRRSYEVENFSAFFPVSLLITCFTHTGFANVLFNAMF